MQVNEVILNGGSSFDETADVHNDPYYVGFQTTFKTC